MRCHVPRETGNTKQKIEKSWKAGLEGLPRKSTSMLELKAGDLEWNDMEWHEMMSPPDCSEFVGVKAWGGYSWNRTLFPDPQAFIDKLHNSRGLVRVPCLALKSMLQLPSSKH